jgi:hypothetical protein
MFVFVEDDRATNIARGRSPRAACPHSSGSFLALVKADCQSAASGRANISANALILKTKVIA